MEVVDKDNNALILMNYNKIEYDKKFDNNYFNLNQLIKPTTENKQESNITNKENDNETNNNEGIPEKEIESQSNNSTNSTTNNHNNDTTTNNNEQNNTQNNNENISTNEEETKETLSIEDVIYPMYLPENTYLTSQERVDTKDGERLILTFGGDNSFVLVEETINKNNSNLVIPVNGEFDFLSDVIGVIGTNSVMWHSNGIEYYMTSNTLETSELVSIARSISILPVSK